MYLFREITREVFVSPALSLGRLLDVWRWIGWRGLLLDLRDFDQVSCGIGEIESVVGVRKESTNGC